MGDFNAKTKELYGLLIPDSERVFHEDVSVHTNLACPDLSLLSQDSNIDMFRKSQDNSKSINYGFKLIKIFTSSNLLILNGRYREVNIIS